LTGNIQAGQTAQKWITSFHMQEADKTPSRILKFFVAYATNDPEASSAANDGYTTPNECGIRR